MTSRSKFREPIDPKPQLPRIPMFTAAIRKWNWTWNQKQNKRLWIAGGELVAYRERRGWSSKQARRRRIARPWPWRANLCACGERNNANRRSLGGDGKTNVCVLLCVCATLLQALLSLAFPLPKAKGWGGVGSMRLLSGVWMNFI